MRFESRFEGSFKSVCTAYRKILPIRDLVYLLELATVLH